MTARFPLAAVLMSFASTVGCCGMHGSLSSNDPCAGELAGKGCCLKKLFDGSHKDKKGCHCGCHAAHCGTTCCEVAPGCAAPVCGDCGVPMMSGGDCGCAAPAGCAAPQGCAVPQGCAAPEVPMRPAQAYEPAPGTKIVPPPWNDAPPAPVPPPGRDSNVVPAVPGTDSPPPPATSSNWKPSLKKSPQMVTYDEFQRLPGQVVSTSSAATPQAEAPAAPTVPSPATPVTSTASSPAPAAMPIIEPATWVPARTN